MEILTIVLASLLGIGSSGGMILDQIAGQKIRSQVISVEQQAVRIDNQPNYRIAQGKLARVRVAGRGVRIKPGLRIASVDLESDPFSFKLAKIRKLDSINSLRESLTAPATGIVRVVLTEEDLNQALQSASIQAKLQATLNRLIASKAGSTNIRYQLSDVQLKLRPKNRLQINFKLSRPRTNLNLKSSLTSGTYQQQNPSRQLAISLELSLKVINGKVVRLLNPQGTVNGRLMSSRLLNGFTTGVSDRLNLNTLAEDGILARILQLEINEDNLQLISFLRLETKMP